MANIGELPYGVLGTAPKFGSAKKLNLSRVYVLQTTTQNEFFYGGVRTSCKKSALDVQNFLFFLLLFGLIAVAVTVAFHWTKKRIY